MSPLACVEIEEGFRRINALAAFYDRLRLQSSEPLGGRNDPAGAAVEGYERTLNEAVVVRAVSIVEAVFQELAERLLEDQITAVASDDPDLLRLLEHLKVHRFSRIGSGSWDELRTFWRDGIGVDLASFPYQSSLAALRTTRHAIVHRLGAATEQYRKQHRQQLSALGLDPDTVTAVALGEAQVREALDLCRRTVRWLHTKLP